jgi:hypothetical protein
MPARGEAARSLIALSLPNQLGEGRPGNSFQNIVEDAIPVQHGFDPFVSR